MVLLFAQNMKKKLLVLYEIVSPFHIKVKNAEVNTNIEVTGFKEAYVSDTTHSKSNQRTTFKNVEGGIVEQVAGEGDGIATVRELDASEGAYTQNWNGMNQFVELIDCGLIHIKQMIKKWLPNSPFIMGGSFQENTNVHAYKLLSGRSYNANFDFSMMEWYINKFDIYPNNPRPLGILITNNNFTNNENWTATIHYRAFNFNSQPMNATIMIVNLINDNIIYGETIHLGIKSGYSNTVIIPYIEGQKIATLCWSKGNNH